MLQLIWSGSLGLGGVGTGLLLQETRLNQLLLNHFLHWLGASLMVVSHVTGLAHAHGVVQSVQVAALGSVLLPTVLPVAGRAHTLGIVLSVRVRAVGDRLRLMLLEVLKPSLHLRLHVLRVIW